MPARFKFTSEQRKDIIKELGDPLAITSLEGLVEDYREKSVNRVSPAMIERDLRDTLSMTRKTRQRIEAIARKTDADAEWLLAPLREYESYAQKLLDYKFRGQLKPGRLRHIPETQLVQAMAALWSEIHGEEPGRGLGPFSRLVRKTLVYSGVQGAPIGSSRELVKEALPARLALKVVGPRYPFTPRDAQQPPLPPLKAAAEGFFKRLDFIASGSPTLTIFAQPRGGEKDEKI